MKYQILFYCVFFLFNQFLLAQFKPTFHFTNTFHLLNYKTDNPVYDLTTHYGYFPEMKVGIQGADIAIFSIGLKYQMMGGKTSNNEVLGASYLLFPIHATFLWNFKNSLIKGFFDAALDDGFKIKDKELFYQGIKYSFSNHYVGLQVSPGIEYPLKNAFSLTFQVYYSLQINDASKNFFIGKFHHYGLSVGLRFIRK
jgi:hypothetical protein